MSRALIVAFACSFLLSAGSPGWAGEPLPAPLAQGNGPSLQEASGPETGSSPGEVEEPQNPQEPDIDEWDSDILTVVAWVERELGRLIADARGSL